jgi:hypothetical protein
MVTIDRGLLEDARILAGPERGALSQLVSEAIEREIARRQRANRKARDEG